jgi:CBS domain-containing protein
MKVQELMSKRVAVCKPSDPLSVAGRLMWECDCGAIPVVDEASGRPVGMITDRDICMSVCMQNQPPSEILVSAAMSRELHSCSPTADIYEAERIMRARQVRRLPVIGPEGRIVGILSLADIAREAERGGKKKSGSVAPEEVTETLGEICHPHQEARGSSDRPAEQR